MALIVNLYLACFEVLEMMKFVSAATLLMLAACGGTTLGGTDMSEGHSNKLRSFAQQNAAIRAMSPTGGARLPTSGTAVFEGRAVITAETPNSDLSYVIVGDSHIDINFSRDFVSGNVTNMVGERTDGSGAVTYHTITGFTELGEDDVAVRYPTGTGQSGFLGSHNFDLKTPDGMLNIGGVLHGQYFGNAANVPAGGHAIRGVVMESVFDGGDTLGNRDVDTSVLITGYAVNNFHLGLLDVPL